MTGERENPVTQQIRAGQDLMTVTVFHNETRGDRFFAWKPASQMAFAERLVVGADTLEGAAEMAFRRCGNDPEFFNPERPRTVRSMSVGDLAVVWGGWDRVKVFACASSGWEDVSDTVDIAIINEATMDPDEFVTWKAQAAAALARLKARRAEFVANIGKDRVNG
jgi:hypothetical protein